MIKRIKCAIGKHAYYEIRRYSDNGSKIGCHNCEKTWAMNHDMRVIVPWDKDFDDLYELLEKFNRKEAKE